MRGEMKKKQKDIEGPLAVIQSDLAFLERSFWQKEVQKEEEAAVLIQER